MVKAINKYLASRFRSYRCNLHMHYKNLRGDDQYKRQHPHDDVTQEDWNSICDWFETDDFKVKKNHVIMIIELHIFYICLVLLLIKISCIWVQKLSEQNSINRQNLQVNHCAGSRSFVRYREEMVVWDIYYLHNKCCFVCELYITNYFLFSYFLNVL